MVSIENRSKDLGRQILRPADGSAVNATTESGGEAEIAGASRYSTARNRYADNAIAAPIRREGSHA